MKNMKRLFLFALLCIVTVFQANAVLKEKDLSQTLGVLRAELERSYNEQQFMMERLQKRNLEQHANLIQMMQKSNQIALMLYSQNTDFTFDMAYACQAATEEYRKLNAHRMPFDKIKARMNSEVARYDSLIRVLQNLPPRLLPNGQLAGVPDSIKAMLPKLVIDTSKMEPFFLDEKGMADRAACIEYATALRDNYLKILQNLSRDEKYYKFVVRHIGELNAYAMSKYEKIQKSIFVNGGDSYFKTLKRFKRYYSLAKRDASDKYKPLNLYSQWRGPVIIGISIFMLFYIFLASVLSYIIMRWLVPKKIRVMFESDKKKGYVTLAMGVAIFAISIMVASFFVKQNFILMAINLMIMFAWLLEVILVSLIIRLNDKQIRSGVRAYSPFLLMAFIVIVFRIILIPNNLVNLIYPPILLAFTIWQIAVLKSKLEKLPDSDMIYTIISLIAMVVACVASWCGFVLLAVEVMIWWTIQLAAIQTITCCYDLAKAYESRSLLRKIVKTKKLDVKQSNEYEKLYKKIQPKMASGEYIAQTWLFDFFYKAMLPVLGVLSILGSIYWAASIFEMTSFCRKIFMFVFLNKPGVIQLSLFKICLVIALYFVFRYINYAVRSFYQMFKKRKMKDVNGPSNITLFNNLISIVVWGIYVVFALILLQVPSGGISIVMAGLATGLGFAMKDILENFIYGLSLMTGRVRVGDYIECDGIQGKVESINYQSTQIVTLDGSVIAFLNSSLFNKNFKNLTRNHGYVLVKIPVGVAYGVNVDRVRQMLLKALQPLMVKNAAGKNVVDVKHGFQVAFSNFGDSSVDLFVICWVLVEEKASFVAKVNEVVYNTLNKNKVEIPFPQHDVYVRHIEIPTKDTSIVERPERRKQNRKKRVEIDSEELEGVVTD